MLGLIAGVAAEALGEALGAEAAGALSELAESGIGGSLEGGKIVVPVKSSFIEAIAYELQTATLTVINYDRRKRVRLTLASPSGHSLRLRQPLRREAITTTTSS